MRSWPEMTEPERGHPDIPKLFISQFSVDYSAPFERHLNRLEVEIGREDYGHLKRVELISPPPQESFFASMLEITETLLKTTQNNYNRELLIRLGIRAYLDEGDYCVYYRLADRAIRFIPAWRQRTLERVFGHVPQEHTDWCDCRGALPGFEGRFIPDGAGGALLLRKRGEVDPDLPVLTATHGPYDPHTLDVALYFLRTGKGRAALINLGFAAREPLTDENLELLRKWGVPLNPSNIDIIYPYVDPQGHPHCYKMEKGLRRYLDLLEGPAARIIIDVHGCVGTVADDVRLVVGLGGFPPYPSPEDFGRHICHGSLCHLYPDARLRRGLEVLRDLSDAIFVQLCRGPHEAYHYFVMGGLHLLGRRLDPRQEVGSLTDGEERSYLKAENVRWLPGAGGNALQRMEARKHSDGVLCLHVEIPTAVRNKMALRLKEIEITESLDSSYL